MKRKFIMFAIPFVLISCGKPKILNEEQRLTTIRQLANARPYRPNIFRATINEESDIDIVVEINGQPRVQITNYQNFSHDVKIKNYQFLDSVKRTEKEQVELRTDVVFESELVTKTKILGLTILNEEIVPETETHYYTVNNLHYADESEYVDPQTEEHGTKSKVDEYYDFTKHIIYNEVTERMNYLYDYNFSLFSMEESEEIIVDATLFKNEFTLVSKINVEKFIQKQIDDFESQMTSEVQIPEYEYTYDEITNEDKVVINSETYEIDSITSSLNINGLVTFSYEENNYRVTIKGGFTFSLDYQNYNDTKLVIEFPNDLDSYLENTE